MQKIDFSVGDEKTLQLYVTPEEAWENLANAVVLEAVADYRTASETLRRRPKNRNASQMKAEAECFFRSDEFTRFTTVPGDVILHLLENEQEEIKKQEELKKQEMMKKQEEMNERKRISGTVSAENGADRSPAGQNCRNTRLRRKMHFRAQPHTGR